MIEKFKAWLLGWLGLDKIRTEIHEGFVDAARFTSESIGSLAANTASRSKDIERESLRRDQNALDQIRLNHETLLNNVKSIVESHVEEHITRLQSSQHRFVSCPVCGKSYNLAASGAAYNTRAITIACDNCKAHFEIRPSLFWNKIEVEKR